MADPYAQFVDFTSTPGATPAPTAAPPAADPQALETARSTVEHLINTGASKDQIVAFMAAHGLAERSGIDAALAARDHGMKVHIPVQLVMPAAPAAPQPNAADPYAHLVDFTPESQGNTDLTVPPHTLTDQLGMGARAILDGAASLPDVLAMPGQLLQHGVDSLLHTPQIPDFHATDATGALSNSLGLATPQTDGERLAFEGIKGATGGLLTAPLGGEGAVPALMSTLSGASAGAGTELARQNGAGPMGQLAAGVTAGFLAPTTLALGGKAVGAFTPMAERELSPTAQAFADQKVPALPADVGGTATKMATAASKMTLGGIPIHEAAQASVNAARAARDRIAAAIGNGSASDMVAGQAAQRGAQSFLQSTADKAAKLYNAIPIAANRPTILNNTQDALKRLTAGLQSNEQLSNVISDPRMERIARAIIGTVEDAPTGVLDAAGNAITKPVQVGGGLSWQDLKDFRTYIGEKAGAQALQSDTPSANLKQLYGALSDDMQQTAQAEGPQAAAAFNRANSYWRARQGRIESVITPILGKSLDATPESAFRAIQAWSGDRGSFVKTAQALRSLRDDEANAVRSSIFQRLGTAAPGAQDATGEVFSPATFLTQWNKLPPEARNVLFPGAQYQKDINDLVTIANAQKAAGKFANTSQTGLAIHVANAGAHILHLFTDPIGTLASLGGQFAVGKLLSSPGFARWLASAPAKPNAAAQLAHINRLTAIAAKQPAIANDVLGLQERLAQAFAQSPQPLAAQPQEQGQ